MSQLLTARLRPPTFPPSLVLTLTLAFVALAFAAGADWALVQAPGTVSQLMLDNSVGLTIWGMALMGGAAYFVAAVASRRHFFVWCGHAFLASVYFGITLTTLQAAIGFGGGAEELVAPVGAVIWHGALACIMRPLPRREGGR